MAGVEKRSCYIIQFLVFTSKLQANLLWRGEKRKKDMENPGIDPDTSRMQSGRSTIWAIILSEEINKTKQKHYRIYVQRGTFEAYIIFVKLFHVAWWCFYQRKEVFILAYALINQQSWKNEDSNNFVVSRLLINSSCYLIALIYQSHSGIICETRCIARHCIRLYLSYKMFFSTVHQAKK